jgi:hypothetical protein
VRGELKRIPASAAEATEAAKARRAAAEMNFISRMRTEEERDANDKGMRIVS